MARNQSGSSDTLVVANGTSPTGGWGHLLDGLNSPTILEFHDNLPGRNYSTMSTLTNWLRNKRRRYHERRRAQRRIEVLRPYLPQESVGAELGVFEGIFTQCLITCAAPVKIHLIDPWFHYCGRWNWASGNPSTVDAVRRILAHWRGDIETGRVVLHIDSDLVALERFGDSYFDWVYIDSSHEYEHTVKELTLLRTKVKRGGIIAGDDWRPDPDHPHHGVFRAVTEAVELGQLELRYTDEQTAQWVTQSVG